VRRCDVLQIVLDRSQQRLQGIAVHGLRAAGWPLGKGRPGGKWRRCAFHALRLIIMNELAMQHVVATAHDEHGSPIADGQQNYAENTKL